MVRELFVHVQWDVQASVCVYRDAIRIHTSGPRIAVGGMIYDCIK